MQRSVDAGESGDSLSSVDQVLATSHYWFGLAILALVMMRLTLRLRRGAPAPVENQPGLMQFAAKAMHVLFYVLLFAAPVLGLMAFYLGDPWGPVHSLVKPLFVVFIGLHAGAALLHQFVLRDGTLRRMLVPAN